jgi:adenosylmethionine-8-amino-7-oxononanoate aminotransferase
LEKQLRTGLKTIKEIAIVGDVRVIGGVAVIELETDSGGYLDQLGPKLTSMFLARGLLLRPLGNILYFMPPYVITDEEVDWVIDQIHTVLNSVSR